MEKSNRRKNFRIHLQNALNKAADKPLNKAGLKRIELLVKLLNTYNKKKPDLSDYDLFLARFNSKYKLNLHRSPKKSCFIRSCGRFIFKTCCRLAAAAAIIVLVLSVSDTAVKASAGESILKWLSATDSSVFFSFNDIDYNNYTISEEAQKYGLTYYGRDYVNNTDVFEIIDNETSKLYYSDIDWSDTMKLNYIPEGFGTDDLCVACYNNNLNQLNIYYNEPNNKYINVSIEQLNHDKDFIVINKPFDTIYNNTIKFNNFIAYIFIGQGKNEAFFCADGKAYDICTNLDIDTLYEILNNINY